MSWNLKSSLEKYQLVIKPVIRVSSFSHSFQFFKKPRLKILSLPLKKTRNVRIFI